MVFHKTQILGNLNVVIEQTDEKRSIYTTTNVVTMHTALQEAAKAHLSGASGKKSLNFVISQE